MAWKTARLSRNRLQADCRNVLTKRSKHVVQPDDDMALEIANARDGEQGGDAYVGVGA
jgi:hypothetical protein